MARRVANAPSCCLCCDRGAGRHWDVQGYRRHSAGLVTGGTCPLMGYAPCAGLGARCMLCPPRVDHGGVCACAVTPPKAASEPTRRAACSCRWGGCYPRMSDVALRDSASFEKVAGFRHAGVKRARPPSSNPLHVAQAGASPPLHVRPTRTAVPRLLLPYADAVSRKLGRERGAVASAHGVRQTLRVC